MYEIIKTFLFYTSGGVVIAHLDEEESLHIMSNDADIIEEVQDKYYRRTK